MSPSIESRLPGIGTSIFAVMSKLALEHGAINLSQGFPDFKIDESLITLVSRYMLDGHNQYAPMPGLLALREQLSAVIARTYQEQVNPETEITITSGATEGIFAAIAAFVNTGDEVILFDPSYDSYGPAIKLNGGVPVHFNLTFPDYSIDWDRLQGKITKRTKLVIVNTPHNPSGSVLQRADLERLEQIAEKNNLLIISDEVYERLIFDGVSHLSVLRSAALRQRSIAVFSFGKTFHATGWKCGYTVAAPHLTAEIRKTHQFIVFSVNTPLQFALADYLKDPNHYEHLGQFYQGKRDQFLKGIKGSSFEPLPCRGSYFQLLSYRAISQKGDVEMATELTEKAKVASIPVSVFYEDRSDNKVLRFCFAKKEQTLDQACEILRKF